ncbi:DUF3656 domain-containing protein [Heliobacterium chlorum]|uniref:DUF3656 domain-containing protein n=1 Tax=Heliobacterium chlorum TaxID=2698 RepID=A0ABR7T0G6_HELCL|nr:DUF3656 domain-containing protein [Heliobacterium chlorum]
MTALPELLAPAGSMEALRAAVENGADAVYLSGKKFGARQYAANFDMNEMGEAVTYAHQRNVRIYVTINTLLDDAELDELPQYARNLYELGVDAVIVQDLGVLRVIQNLLPQWEIHASTQMTVSNTEGARLLAAQGVHRVVPARELTLQDITELCQVPGLEVEVFVHGALCIGYSGQCLMSSLIGGRSGNRGRCAQPCRLGYGLVDASGREMVSKQDVGQHLLSPKDIKTIEHLPELVRAGIHSLKIEGRMKKPEYVATVVRQYRQALDRTAAKEPFAVDPGEDRALRQIFNRDFAPAYLLGNPGRDLMSYKRPNNRGLFLGRVKSYDAKRQQARIVLEEDLNLGDEIEAWVTRGGRVATTVEKIWVSGQVREKALAGEDVTAEWRGNVRNGDRIFKIHDELLTTQARESYQRPGEGRRNPLRAHVWATVGQPVVIEFRDAEGRFGRGVTTDRAQEARNRPLTTESLTDQLGRLGNTAFRLEQVELEGDGKAMVPVSQLNEARREAIAELEKRRSEGTRPVRIDESQWQAGLAHLGLIRRGAEKAGWSEKASFAIAQRPRAKERKGQGQDEPLLTVTVEGLNNLKTALSTGIDEVYLSTEGFRQGQPFRPGEEKTAVSLCRAAGIPVVVALPRVYRAEHRSVIEGIIRRWFEAGVKSFLLPNLGYVELVKSLSESDQIEIRADYPLWVFNGQAARSLQELGAATVTLSPELSLEQMRAMSHSGLVRAGMTMDQTEIVVHGSLPMMVSEYCATGALLGGRTLEKSCDHACQRHRDLYLIDRLNFRFPLYTDSFCRMHILNPKDLSLLENLPDLLALGVKRLRIEGRTEDASWLKALLPVYRKALRSAQAGDWNNDTVQSWIKDLERVHPPGYTKGHLFRGVE